MTHFSKQALEQMFKAGMVLRYTSDDDPYVRWEATAGDNASWRATANEAVLALLLGLIEVKANG